MTQKVHGARCRELFVFDIIASGSLPGIDYKRASSYPVRYVDYLRMYGLDFKSGNTRASSLKLLMKKYKDICYGYKFVDGNIGVSEDRIITLPLYMAAFIQADAVSGFWQRINRVLCPVIYKNVDDRIQKRWYSRERKEGFTDAGKKDRVYRN